jgi:GTPase SAR1 family protein
MGTVLELCTCNASETVIPNYKSLIDDENKVSNNNKNEVNDQDNAELEEDKNDKKIINNEIKNNKTNEIDAYDKKNSSSNALLLTSSKKRRHSKISKNSKNKEKDKNKDKDKKSKKESKQNNGDEKSPKKRKNKNKTDTESKNDEKTKKNNNEEITEKINISETLISELVLNDKLKTIPKEKKKKIKGRNNINFVIIGDKDVGKSAFCIRYNENRFEDFYIPSIAKENYAKIINFNSHNYKLNFTIIWEDIEIYNQESSLAAADCFIIIYDITKIRSFNLINIYLRYLKKYIFFFDKEGKNPNFCLAANKSDLEGYRKVGLELVNKSILNNGFKHFDISVKTGKNIINIIQYFIQIFDKIAFSEK